jgi:hypothetical protein
MEVLGLVNEVKGKDGEYWGRRVDIADGEGRERIVFGDVDVDEAGHRRMWICLGRYLVRRDGRLS